MLHRLRCVHNWGSQVMPQKKAKKRGDNGFSLQLQKVGGYAYTKKFIELQALVRSLQAQAEAAKQQVEDSQQREMVSLQRCRVLLCPGL